MAVEYLGLSSVNGPFVVLEGVQGASFDEVVEITSTGNDGLQEKKLGRVVEINDDKAVIQVFEKTENLSPAKYPYPFYRTSHGDRPVGILTGKNLQRHRRAHR